MYQCLNESPVFCTTEDIYKTFAAKRNTELHAQKTQNVQCTTVPYNYNFIVFCSKHHIVTIILYLSAFILALSFHYPSFPTEMLVFDLCVHSQPGSGVRVCCGRGGVSGCGGGSGCERGGPRRCVCVSAHSLISNPQYSHCTT